MIAHLARQTLSGLLHPNTRETNAHQQAMNVLHSNNPVSKERKGGIILVKKKPMISFLAQRFSKPNPKQMIPRMSNPDTKIGGKGGIEKTMEREIKTKQ